MLTACQNCQEIMRGEKDASFHEELLVVQAKYSSEQSNYTFYCKTCSHFFLLKLSLFQPLEDEKEWVRSEQIDENLLEQTALAMFADERRQFIQSRIQFLKREKMPVYEPIQEKEWEQFIDSFTSNVHRLPSHYVFEHLETQDTEFLWNVYAEPTDFCLIQSSTKVPRYYRSYLIPAEDADPVVQIKKNESSRLSLWLHDVGMIYQLSVYDAKEERFMEGKEFAETVTKDMIWTEFPLSLKKQALKPHLDFLKTRLLQYV